MDSVRPTEQRSYDTARLVADYPPVWEDRNKQAVFDICCPPGAIHGGQLVFRRWSPMPLPETLDTEAAIRLLDGREDHYDYVSLPGTLNETNWHVNFADPNLFTAYGSSLFAQDEAQVAEHPALGSLKEALIAEGVRDSTVEGGGPTPVTVTGVERRCSIATDQNLDEGRPYGLYGNQFAHASPAAVEKATTRIDPPAVTNLIAIAAPYGSYGEYEEREIRYVLDTAYTGFRAATLESERLTGVRGPIVVHSGFWGCGAFGGNRVLMALLQMLAAEMAGLERLVMHSFDAAGTAALSEATSVIRTELSGSRLETDQVIQQIHSLGFKWGVSDGN